MLDIKGEYDIDKIKNKLNELLKSNPEKLIECIIYVFVFSIHKYSFDEIMNFLEEFLPRDFVDQLRNDKKLEKLYIDIEKRYINIRKRDGYRIIFINIGIVIPCALIGYFSSSPLSILPITIPVFLFYNYLRPKRKIEKCRIEFVKMTQRLLNKTNNYSS